MCWDETRRVATLDFIAVSPPGLLPWIVVARISL